jgi:bifunctional non-homologous end joining protein LigD
MKVVVGNYTIDVSNEDKILFGAAGVTKGDLVKYYEYMAPTMLPYYHDRPVALQRFPDGVTGEIFFQKEAGDYFPDWITRATIKGHDGGVVHYVVADKCATLVYLAQQACTPHIWMSRVDNIEKPDRMIFDFDPDDSLDFTDVQWAVKQFKKLLDEFQLPSFFMLTGSRGVHVVVPLLRFYTFDKVRMCAHTIATIFARLYPDCVTVDLNKEKRGKRIFIDWLRNSFGATAVAPYAVRAREGAPIAMPVSFKELCARTTTSCKYTLTNKVLYRRHDISVWWGMCRAHVSLKNLIAIFDTMKVRNKT